MAVALILASGRGRLGAVSPLQPVVVDADRLQLALYRRHDHHHVLDHRGGFHRGRLFMAYCVFRFRHKEGQQAAYEPENKKLEWWLTVVTAVGVAAMLAPGLVRLEPVRHRSERCDRGRGRRPAMAVELPLPGKDGRLGTSECPVHQFRQSAGLESTTIRPDRTMSSIDSDDLHLPVGKPVKVLLRSIDVLHDFYVPEFRAKMDMMPGWSPISGSRPPGPGHSRFFAPSSAVSAHPQMRGNVVVETREGLSGVAAAAADLRRSCRRIATREGALVNRQRRQLPARRRCDPEAKPSLMRNERGGYYDGRCHA